MSTFLLREGSNRAMLTPILEAVKVDQISFYSVTCRDSTQRAQGRLPFQTKFGLEPLKLLLLDIQFAALVKQ